MAERHTFVDRYIDAAAASRHWVHTVLTEHRNAIVYTEIDCGAVTCRVYRLSVEGQIDLDDVVPDNVLDCCAALVDGISCVRVFLPGYDHIPEQICNITCDRLEIACDCDSTNVVYPNAGVVIYLSKQNL